jgi:hypothetical protein
MGRNKNKVGTCKCLDYYTDDNNDYYVKQVKKPNKKIFDLKCSNPVHGNTDFCEKHQDCPKFFKKFLNSEEPVYNPSKWSEPYIEGSHNCYTYFLDSIYPDLIKKCEKLCKKNSSSCPKKIKQCRSLIPQPGDNHLLEQEGHLRNKTYKYTCDEMDYKIKNDNPGLKKSELIKKCPKNHHKGAMVVDPGNTFHFYRQNRDGTWSHKPGTLPVTNLDADKEKIYTPYTANRDYTKIGDSDPINYTNFCGYYCIPNDKKLKAR